MDLFKHNRLSGGRDGQETDRKNEIKDEVLSELGLDYDVLNRLRSLSDRSYTVDADQSVVVEAADVQAVDRVWGVLGEMVESIVDGRITREDTAEILKAADSQLSRIVGVEAVVHTVNEAVDSLRD